MLMRKSILLASLMAILGCLFSFGCLRYTHFIPATLNAYGFGSDADVYWDLSGNLLNGRGYTVSPGMHPVLRHHPDPLPNISTAPGYPWALAAVRWVWDDIRVAYVLQVVFYAGLLLLVAIWPLTLSGSVGWRWGILAAIAFWPGFLLQLPSISSEMGTAFFGALLVVGMSRGTLTGWSFSLLGAVLMVAFRSNTILFVFTWLFLYALLDWRRGIRSTAWKSAVIVGAVLLVYTGWGLRNQRFCGDRVFSAYAGQVIYAHYIGNTPALRGGKWSTAEERESFVQQQVAQGATWSQAERRLYQTLTRYTVDTVRRNPGKATVALVRAWSGFFLDSYFKIPDLLWSRMYGLPLVDNRKMNSTDVRLSPISRFAYWTARIGSLVIRLGILGLFLLAPVFIWRLRDQRLEWMVLWCSVFVFLAGTALVSASGDRQQVPVSCFVLLLVLRVLSILREKQA